MGISELDSELNSEKWVYFNLSAIKNLFVINKKRKDKQGVSVL